MIVKSTRNILSLAGTALVRSAAFLWAAHADLCLLLLERILLVRPPASWVLAGCSATVMLVTFSIAAFRRVGCSSSSSSCDFDIMNGFMNGTYPMLEMHITVKFRPDSLVIALMKTLFLSVFIGSVTLLIACVHVILNPFIAVLGIFIGTMTFLILF